MYGTAIIYTKTIKVKKYLAFLSLLISVQALTLSCGNNNSKEGDSKISKNRTQIQDSIYNFFYLSSMDTMEGFDAYFRDSNNVKRLEDDFAMVKGLDSTYASFDEKLILNAMLTNQIRNAHRNRIRLNQKGSKWKYGCYEGTIRTVKFVLRDDKSFDIHSIVLFGNDLYEGTYTLKSDTLYLSFTTEKPSFMSDTMLMTEDWIRSIPERDAKNYYLSFYLGDCLGLN